MSQIQDDEQPLRGLDRPDIRTRESVTTRSVGGCCAKVFLFGFGAVLAAVGLTLCLVWPLLTNKLVMSQLALSKDSSRSLDMWLETPIPMYMRIYLFNWTNPKTSLHGPEKPAFTQMGPYVFLEHISKKNIIWNDNNSTVTYMNQKQWHFVPEMSNGTLNDTVTNLNMIAMTVGWHCLSISPLFRRIVNTMLTLEESLLKTDTVGNLLFNGSNDRLLNIFSLLRPYIKTLPDMDKFGYFYKRNMSLTADGIFNMYTGKGNIDNLGLVSAWDYKNRTVFPGQCGKVQGTYGEEFPPGSVDQSQITIFANDLCSVLNLQRQSSTSVLGIPSVTFAGGEDVFSNATTCYCSSNTSCPASGVRDISLCNGSPVMMSWPHFYLADPSYLDAVVGMSPNQEEHQFYMTLSEVTSSPMEVRGRMQLNVLMQSVPDMDMFKNIKRTVMPMLWFDQGATMTESLSSQISTLVKLVTWGRWALLGVGVIGVLLVGLGVLLQARGAFSHHDDRLLQ